MSNEDTSNAARLPDYITSATPNPAENRAPWFKNTAPTYAGIFLWFVFWQEGATAPNLGGLLSGGVAWALACVVVAAMICQLLFYLVRAVVGMKTGLPL
jgi:cytosine permease